MKRIPEWAKAGVLAALLGLGGAWLGSRVENELPSVAVVEAAPAAPVAAGARAFVVTNKKEVPRSKVRVAVATRNGVGEVVSLKVFTAVPTGAEKQWKLSLTQTIPKEGAVELDLPAGAYFFQADGPSGHAERLYEVVPDHEHDVWLLLESSRSIRIHVVAFNDGQPVKSAVALTLVSAGMKSEVFKKYTADSFGRIDVKDAPASAAIFEVTALGFTTRTVTAQPGDAEVEVALAATTSIQGFVRDDEGFPIAGAKVSAEAETAVSDATGHYLVHSAEKKVTLSAIDPAGRSATREIANEKGEPVDGIDFQLGVPHHVYGNVFDDQHLPVPGAVVTAITEARIVLATATTDENGRFNLDGLPPKVFQIHAQSGRGAATNASPVTVDAADPLVMVLKTSAVIIGVIRDSAGAPVAYATVHVTTNELDTFSESETMADDSGAYRIADLPPGPARVQARGPAGSVSKSESVYLSSAAAVRCDLTIQRVGTVHATLKGGDGKPVHVALAGTNFWLNSEALTDSVTLQAPEGRYSLGASRDRSMRRLGTEVKIVAGQVTEAEVAVDVREGFVDSPDDSVTPGDIGAAFEDQEGRTVVSFLISGGPAARGGLAMGDEVLTIDGTDIHSSSQAFAAAHGRPGTTAQLSLRTRAGPKTVAIVRP